MAQFLAARGWAPPDPLTLYLRENFSDGIYIIAATRIYGCSIDALVLAPDGLYVLYPRSWLGDIRASADGAWIVAPDGGAAVEVPSPAHEAHHCQLALDAFLKDEFPGLHPLIHHVVVLMMPDARAVIEPSVWPRLTTLATVVEMIMAPQTSVPHLEELQREQLAVALRDRQLSHSQRASEPFIFRTGSRTTWTVREAIQHMDRHPADGIYHLRNGTLIRWLRKEGAEHVAKLAEEVMSQVVSDERAMLETFLGGTGLVARPILTMHPVRVDLGNVVSGDRAGTVVRLQQKGGRGYLFGSFFASEPWLSIEPDHFASAPVDVGISVDTGMLPIRAMPYTATVEVHSSASDTPLPIAVRFKIVGMPSHLERYILRPLLNATVTGIIGLCLGALVGIAVDASPMGYEAGFFWTTSVALFWALIGAIYGVYQPPGLAQHRALWHWVGRLTLWTVVLLIVVAALVWTEQRMDIWLNLGIPYINPIRAGLAGALIAPIPALIGIRRRKPFLVEKRQSGLRPTRIRRVVAAAVILLGVLLVTSLGFTTMGDAANQLTVQTGELLSEFEGRLDRWTDELILWIYDRRAPAQ